MSKSTRIVFLVFLALSLFFSGFISALRVMALEDFEIGVGYFAYGARLPDVVNYLLFATVLIFFVAGLYLRGRVSLASSERGIPFYFGNAVLGASLAAYALFSFPVFFEPTNLSVFSSPLSGTLLLLCTLLAVAGVFFCIHNCLFPNAEPSRRLLFGLSLPLFAVINILYLYFDTSSPLNAPNKLFDQFTYVFIALYLLYELRVLLKEPRYAAQCSLGLIAMVFTAVNGFPSFIYMLLHGEQLSDNAAHDVLMISFFIYVTVRMAHILFTESARNDRILELLTEAEHPAVALSRQDGENEEEDEENADGSQLTFDTVDSLEIEIIPDEALTPAESIPEPLTDGDADLTDTPREPEESGDEGTQSAEEDSVSDTQNGENA